MLHRSASARGHHGPRRAGFARPSPLALDTGLETKEGRGNAQPVLLPQVIIEKIILRAKRLILQHRLLPRRLDHLLKYYLVNIMSREQHYKYIFYFYEFSEDYLEKARNDFLHDWEKECIQRYFTNKESLLIISGGGGREAIMLAGKFKTIHATECNKRFFDRAKQAVPDNLIMHRIGARELPATG